MNFDIVIANPPYDRTDIQMKFGLACFDICTKYNVMIIPAKWQCKGDKTKEKLYSTFRKEVVPHMSKICFYPEATEAFDIMATDGVTYYIADKQREFNIKTIENRCKVKPEYNTTREREFTYKSSLNNIGQDIIYKLKNISQYLVSENIDEKKKYQVWCGALVSTDSIISPSGKWVNSVLSAKAKSYILGPSELNSNTDIENNLQHDNYNPLFTSDSMLEVASFLSYAYTKFVRFLIFNSICGLGSTGQDTWWRFVPDPVAFDHLFTDEELYRQYNLTPDEIAIIEGTIAERPFSTVWSWIPKEYQELAQ